MDWNDPQQRKEYLARYVAEHADELRAKKAQYRAEHPEEIKAAKARYYRENREEIAAKKAQHRIDHPEETKIADAQRYAKSAEKQKATKRKQYAEHPEGIKARVATYRAANPEKVRAANARWYAEHPEQAKANHIRWKTEHPEESRTMNMRREARKRDLPATFTTKARTFMMAYWGYACAVCERQEGLFGWTLADDHAIPLSSPDCPGTVASNMLPLCHGRGGCNNSKKDKNLHVWLVARLGKRKAAVIIKRITAYFDMIRQHAEI